MSTTMTVFYGLIAALFLGATIGFAVIADAEFSRDGVEARAAYDIVTSTAWTLGLLGTGLYTATAVGVGRRSLWGRALAHFLTPLTFAIALPLAIAQWFVLTRVDNIDS